MTPPDKSRLTNQERIAAIQAVRQWTPLAERYPEPGQHVWVKMDDGVIELAHWDSARASWSHSPFERWGQPESWAPLTPAEPRRKVASPASPHPISGTAPSRVRPEQRESDFALKFLSALFQ